MSHNWVDELARRLPGREFVNAGINGETSAQALARVPEVVACTPRVCTSPAPVDRPRADLVEKFLTVSSPS